MYKGKTIITVIPARGGSKGIYRKNIRMLNSKPMIFYPIKASLSSRYIDITLVTSDDETILDIAETYGAYTIKRPKELAEDQVPLDPVIYHAVYEYLKRNRKRLDIVITIQPTQPLIDAHELDDAIEYFFNNNLDTLIFATDATHLYWIKREKWIPLFKERKNRQYLSKIAREIGVIITKIECLKPDNRFGKKIDIYMVGEEKGIDIDTHLDLALAKELINRRKIAYVVEGRKGTGLGHIYRSLTIAEKLLIHKHYFFTNGLLGKKIIEKHGYHATIFNKRENLIKHLSKLKPDIIINDILDTDTKFIIEEKEKTGALIVNFEDLGPGANHADIVFNALYEFSNPPEHHYYGYRYFILREEFKLFPIKNYSSSWKPSRKIIVLFGGTDPNNLTLKTIKALFNSKITGYTINVVIGPGYQRKKELKEFLSIKQKKGLKIKVYETPPLLSKLIYDSDFAITSNGRTLYEITSLGVPSISIAQNEREMLHPFAHLTKGIVFLGMASQVNMRKITQTIHKLTRHPHLLRELNDYLIPYAKQIRKGDKRVINTIFDRIDNDD